MEIVRDRLYRTRSGEIRRVICTDAPGYQPIIAVCLKTGALTSHSADGRWKPSSECNLDLIAPYTEPREWWLYRYRPENEWSAHPFKRDHPGEWVKVREVVE